MEDYFPVEIGGGMQDGVYADDDLPVGAEEAFRVKLLFEAGERKVYDVFLPALGDSEGDLVFRIEIGDVADLKGPDPVSQERVP